MTTQYYFRCIRSFLFNGEISAMEMTKCRKAKRAYNQNWIKLFNSSKTVQSINGKRGETH